MDVHNVLDFCITSFASYTKFKLKKINSILFKILFFCTLRSDLLIYLPYELHEQ